MGAHTYLKVRVAFLAQFHGVFRELEFLLGFHDQLLLEHPLRLLVGVAFPGPEQLAADGGLDGAQLGDRGLLRAQLPLQVRYAAFHLRLPPLHLRDLLVQTQVLVEYPTLHALTLRHLAQEPFAFFPRLGFFRHDCVDLED